MAESSQLIQDLLAAKLFTNTRSCWVPFVSFEVEVPALKETWC